MSIGGTGLDLSRCPLTTSPANDAHAVWTLRWTASPLERGMRGWREEAAFYDRTFQPYGQILENETDGPPRSLQSGDRSETARIDEPLPNGKRCHRRLGCRAWERWDGEMVCTTSRPRNR